MAFITRTGTRIGAAEVGGGAEFDDCAGGSARVKILVSSGSGNNAQETFPTLPPWTT